MDERTWRRSFAAGVVVFGLSVGGSFIPAETAEADPCPARARWAVQHEGPRMDVAPLFTKVARAALTWALHSAR